MSRLTLPLLAHLGLLGLTLGGCPTSSPPPPTAAAQPASSSPPRWTDDLAQLELVALDETWSLTPLPQAGGATGVEVRVDKVCKGRVWRSRAPGTTVADRDASLEARILARLEPLGISDQVIRDRGEVPHGDFRAYMVRADGQRSGRPWSCRVTATYVTRPSGRFYVEILATSDAMSFVTKRACFDALTASVTIRSEER